MGDFCLQERVLENKRNTKKEEKGITWSLIQDKYEMWSGKNYVWTGICPACPCMTENWNCIVQLFPSNENPILYFLNIYNFVIIVKYVFPSKHTCIHDVYIYVWYVNIKFDPITVRAVNVSDEWRLQLRKFTDL